MAAAIVVPILVKVVVPLLTSEMGEHLIAKIFERHPHLKEKHTMASNPQPVTAANAVYAHLASAQAALQGGASTVEEPATTVVAEPTTAARGTVTYYTGPVAAVVDPEVPQVATVPAPIPAKQSAGQIADTILHDVIATGILAASIFVKNPASQQTAANLINAVQQLLPMLDAQLNPGGTA